MQNSRLISENSNITPGFSNVTLIKAAIVSLQFGTLKTESGNRECEARPGWRKKVGSGNPVTSTEQPEETG